MEDCLIPYWKSLWNAFQPYHTILQLLAMRSCCLWNLISTKYVFDSITPGWMPHALVASCVNGKKIVHLRISGIYLSVSSWIQTVKAVGSQENKA